MNKATGELISGTGILLVISLITINPIPAVIGLLTGLGIGGILAMVILR